MMRTTRSVLDRVQRIGSRARDTQPIRRSEACRLARGASFGKKVWDKKKSPL